MLIEVNIVVTAILGLMAVLTAGASLALKRSAALLWASGCFACATAQNLTIYYASGSSLEAVSSVLVATISFWFANQTLCALTGEWKNRVQFHVPFFGLLAAALTMMAAGTEAQTIGVTAELARFTAIVDACLRLAHGRRGRPLQTFLFAAFLMLIVSRAARIIMLASQPGIDFKRINSSQAEVSLAFSESLLAIFIIILVISDLVWRTITTFRDQSEQDSLTGLLNRRGLTSLAATPSRTGGAVIYCDIDHFKSINDRFGHPAGDAIIARVGVILADLCQTVGRIGGEEFAMILQGASVPQAAQLAEAMRLRIIRAHAVEGSQTIEVTASFGVASYEIGSSPQSAFEAADRALYRAKRGGRNRVAIDADGSEAVHPTLRIRAREKLARLTA